MEENETLTIEQMKELAWDTYILHAEVIVPLLVKAYERQKRQIQDDRVATAIEHLKSWDYRSSKESIAYSYMHYWGQVYKEKFGEEFSKFAALTRYEVDLNSPEEQEKALTALLEAIETLEEKFGKAEVPWGEINVVIRGGRFPIGGNWGYENLHPDYGPVMDNGEIHCDDGWGHVLVVAEGERKEIWSLLPYGQSQDPASPHFNDQAKMHSERTLKRFWFYPEEILEHTETVWGDEARLNSGSYR